MMQMHPKFESQKEAHAFDFYLKGASAALSGDLDTELWRRIVVQLSIREPAVKYAALAISSLHRRVDMTHRESRQRRNNLDVDGKFALTQYGKAMQALRVWKPAPGDNDRATVPLILCLLFVTIEFLRGDQEISQLHICQGRKLLAELREGELPSHTTELLTRHVVPVYTRLGLACHLFATVPEPIPAHFVSLTAKSSTNKHDLPFFTSIDQARDELYDKLDELIQFINSAGRAAYAMTPSDPEDSSASQNILDIIAQQNDLLTRLEQWDAALAMLSAKLPSSAIPTTTLHLLKIHYNVVKTWIATSLKSSETCFDEHLEAFSAVVSNSAIIIDAMDKHPAKDIMYVFSFETELIAPLYWTCAKCRHPGLRRAALELLQREEMRTRRENQWSAETMAAVSAHLIALEENRPDMETTANTGANDMVQKSSGESFSAVVFPATTGDAVGMENLPAGSIEAESLINELLRVPTSKPPGIPAYPDFKLLAALTEDPRPNEFSFDVPLYPEVPVDTKDGELLPESLKGSPSLVPSPVVQDPIPLTTTAATNDLVNPNVSTPNPSAPSFGIPDDMRVKNTLIGPINDQGVWVATFKEPPIGESEWDVQRKFIHL